MQVKYSHKYMPTRKKKKKNHQITESGGDHVPTVLTIVYLMPDARCILNPPVSKRMLKYISRHDPSHFLSLSSSSFLLFILSSYLVSPPPSVSHTKYLPTMPSLSSTRCCLPAETLDRIIDNCDIKIKATLRRVSNQFRAVLDGRTKRLQKYISDHVPDNAIFCVVFSHELDKVREAH